MTTKTKSTTVTARPKARRSAPASTTFSLYAPNAREVFLLGDFNDWRPDGLKARKFKDGTWRKALPLKAGVYQYLFLVDGEWWLDPINSTRVRNPFGTENSVISIG